MVTTCNIRAGRFADNGAYRKHTAGARPPATVAPTAAGRLACRGRLFAGDDEYGTYWSCLTCGYVAEDPWGRAVTPSPRALFHCKRPR